MSQKTVCSTTHLFHYFLSANQDDLVSFLQKGIRPLSDFPESDRWQQLQQHAPGFYENLYALMAQPLLQKPYSNSGIFITPIDFRLIEGSILYNKPRFKIPMDRIDPRSTVITYVFEEERVVLPFSGQAFETIAGLWSEAQVRRWFAVDKTKIFFYVPQVATYQGHIPIGQDDFEPADVAVE